ncbi:MAG: WG repeat-containing protein [Nostocaceae cyanobacterium CSU_2_110]|nr:WG repeat-containing protein [Nostocaceae cyanobacterium CSU_2_110]
MLAVNGVISIKKGLLAIKTEFDIAKDFSQGLALVKLGNKFGYINKLVSLSSSPNLIMRCLLS